MTKQEKINKAKAKRDRKIFEKLMDALNLIDEHAERGNNTVDEEEERGRAYEKVADYLYKAFNQ